MYGMRVENHNIYVTKSKKKILCPLDTKKWILDDGINSYAYGHYKIQDIKNGIERIEDDSEEMIEFLATLGY